MDCFLKIKKQYAQKKVLILGLGLQGGGLMAAKLFTELNCSVIVSDLRTEQQLKSSLAQLKQYPQVKFELGEHKKQSVLWADLIIRNPGVKINAPVLAYARQHQKEILMPSMLFFKHCSIFTIGVTGTRGKSTTTNLIYSVLKKQLPHKTIHLAGNLPNLSVLRLLKKVDPEDWLVCEFSSWQLQGLRQIKYSPNLAVLTNIYPDHLNFYPSFDDYIQDKQVIVRFQKTNEHFFALKKVIEQYPIFTQSAKSQKHFIKSDFYSNGFQHLLGQHNQENASLALAVTQHLKVPTLKAKVIINQFPSLTCRLEYLGSIKSVPVYNDSTSTTPVAGIKAIQAIKVKYPHKLIALVLGGNSKNLPWQEYLELINSEVNKVYLIPGTFTEEVKSSLAKNVKVFPESQSINKLWQTIVNNLQNSEVVLFSPGATSFATFQNEFDRGQQFTKAFMYFKTKYGS